MTHYETLGVAPDATDDEIKQRYRSLAQKLHPDKPEGDKARFQAVEQAYSVLRDARAAYDRGEPTEKRTRKELVEAQAVNALLACVDQLVQQCDDVSIGKVDLRAALISSIDEGLRSIKDEKRKVKRNIRKFKSMEKRIKAGEFIFKSWARQQRQKALQTYKQHLFVSDVTKRMRVLAVDLSYEFEPQLHPFFPGGSQPTFARWSQS